MTVLPRRSLLLGSAALAATAAVSPTRASARPSATGPSTTAGRDRRRTLHRWAAATWTSLVAMTDEHTGLSADNIGASVTDPVRSGFTSPTNVGGYLWSVVVARELGLVSRSEAHRRLAQTLHTLARLEIHEPSGMFYNWYSEATGEKLIVWPVDGGRVDPFLSSVDNGWLGAALQVVRHAATDDRDARLATRLLDRMRFDAFYDAAARPDLGTGLLRGGFWPALPPGNTSAVRGNYLGVGPDVFYTANWYDTTVSETRIATYLAVARGQVPAKLYFGTWRTFPAGCDWSWQETQPIGRTRRYLGVDVFEGAYPYRGMRVVPGWGGSMFEALMPDVFVPEERWAPRSWGVNHPATVRAHREHGLREAGYGYWGFSPASDPAGGYREYGVDAIGLNPEGYFSDQQKTNRDAGFGDCRAGTNPRPTYGDGVVTPHAAFLAMMHEPRQAFDNLVRIERRLGAYGAGGFYDAVAVGSGTVARRYLSLDQAMIMGALGQVVGDGVLRRAFCDRTVQRTIRPLIAMEEFGARL